MIDILSDLKTKASELTKIVSEFEQKTNLYKNELEKINKAIQAIEPQKCESEQNRRCTDKKVTVEEILNEFIQNLSLDKDEIKKNVATTLSTISDLGKKTYETVFVPVSKEIQDGLQTLFSEKPISKREFISKLLENEVLTIKYKRIRDGKEKTFLATNIGELVLQHTDESNLKYALHFNREINKASDYQEHLFFFDLNDKIFKKIAVENIIEIGVADK